MTPTTHHQSRARWLLVPVIAVLIGAAIPAGAAAQDPPPPISAFVDVNVVPLDRDGPLASQTVLVEGGRILEVGPVDTVDIPEGATIVQGDGGYLIPGLANGHFHVLGDPRNLVLALANGQTTVTAFNASPEDMQLAAEVAAGERMAPRIITGPNVSGLLPIAEYAVMRVRDAALPLFTTDRLIAEAGLTFDGPTAERFVREMAAAGADFIKINVFVNQEVFDAVVAAAAEFGLPVQGHVSGQIGLEHFIESGAYVHHFSEVAPYLSSTDVQGFPIQKWSLDLVDENLPRLVELMKQHDQWFTPTAWIGAQVARIMDDPGSVSSRPELRYVDPAIVGSWDDPERNVLYANIGDGSENQGLGARVVAFNKRLIHDLHAAGVPLIAGEDAVAVPWTVQGFELAEELETFVDAGLTPQEALESASRSVAALYGQDAEWGTIEVGKEADLVLLGSDPLEDISNVRDIRGVMLGGVWLPREQLQAMLDEIATGYASTAIELEPWASPEMGISGVAPSGWTAVDAGIWTRGGTTFFVQLAAPVAAVDELTGRILQNLGATELGDPAMELEIAGLNWAIHRPQAEAAVVLARATDDERAYVVAIAAAPAGIDGLVETLLQPALQALQRQP